MKQINETEIKETIYNIQQLENKETEIIKSISNKDFKNSLNELKNKYSYNQDFNLMVKSVLKETDLNLISKIINPFKDYKLLNQFNDLKNQYADIINKETELNDNNIYIKKWYLKEIRNSKRLIINDIRKMLKDYKNNFGIIRKQHFLKSISLNQYKRMIFYKIDFNIKKRNHIKNKSFDLFFKYSNQKENRIFKLKLQNLKNALLHIKQHNNRNSIINKKGYYKQIEIITKWFLRYNSNNHNIKFNGIMIYLFIQHFELINLNDNVLKRINKVLENTANSKQQIGINKNKEIIFKDNDLIKTNIYKDLFYITDKKTEFKTTNTEINFNETKEINNNSIKDNNRINLLFKNRIKLLMNTETEIYRINSFNDNLKPLKEIIKYKNYYFYKLDNGLLMSIETNIKETETNNKKIKSYFITETETKPILRELIYNKSIGYNETEKFKDNIAVIIELKGNTIITDLKTLNSNKPHKTEIKLIS